MAPLLRDGYNVVTWDPRGEWSSGGVLQIDHPDFEGKDMQAIISFIAAQPEAELDPGYLDPRIGMVGASYGGGIQLVTAAIDKRVDAIVPTIAWHNLNDSLDKAGAPKTSWGALLTLALLGTGARVNPQIYSAVFTALFTGQLPQNDQDFLSARSPLGLLDKITAPTLFFQGTVDTLFGLQEANDNAIALIQNGVPTKVVWYCGGHGACITGAPDGQLMERDTLSWLDRYVKGDLTVNTGPQFEWVDQRGDEYSSITYPVPPAGQRLEATSAGGKLPLVLLLGGSGPNWRAFSAGPINGLLGFLSGAYATNAVSATATASQTTYLVGAPNLKFSYSGTGVSTHIYAQLVDNQTGLVIGNQVTPIAVNLDGKQHQVDIPMEMIAQTLRPGESVTLQIVASAVPYQAFWSSGSVNISNVELSLPSVDAAHVIPSSSSITTAA
jgi:ABC-2 type transport system ATP-binding protein